MLIFRGISKKRENPRPPHQKALNLDILTDEDKEEPNTHHILNSDQ